MTTTTTATKTLSPAARILRLVLGCSLAAAAPACASEDDEDDTSSDEMDSESDDDDSSEDPSGEDPSGEDPSGEDPSGEDSSGDGEQTCSTSHTCINDVCQCETPGLEGEPCTDDDECVDECEVCS